MSGEVHSGAPFPSEGLTITLVVSGWGMAETTAAIAAIVTRMRRMVL
jgi:hypothetical protein